MFQLATVMGFQTAVSSTKNCMTEQDMAVTAWTAQGIEMDQTVNAVVRTTTRDPITTVLPATAMR